ncbi:glutathione S-transferase [Roseivivax lentus]|uniref:Glutathione S-transferase n=1 Tax=Roseivivax lentus TaxID=633194 RepID=A0A1N7N6M1_9RHOB|nr:glutathione S-transferase family protein [Roseivivax lentus]SIS93992.1 glutathione S-transferase [Roseivivax lentus]
MTDLLLYGHPDSGHACKVALALRLAHLPHRVETVDIWAPPETRQPAFLAANPASEVPCLMIDGVPHVQSGAILIEIAERFGVLGGGDAARMRRGLEILFWEANRIGMCVPQLLAAAKDAGDFPPDVIRWLKNRYAADCARFDLYLGQAPFLHGPEPGIGDCAVWGYTQWLDRAGLAPTGAMADWLERMRALPGMAAPEVLFPA